MKVLRIEMIFESLIKALILGALSFGVSYIKNIGIEAGKLNISLIQLKYELRAFSDNQNNVNKALMEKLNSHENRISFIERRRHAK